MENEADRGPSPSRAASGPQSGTIQFTANELAR